MDFAQEDGILRFAKGQNKECINITLNADSQVEMTESFDVLLQRRSDTHERIIIERGETAVNIINDDGKSIHYSYCCTVIPVYCTRHRRVRTHTHTHTHNVNMHMNTQMTILILFCVAMCVPQWL